MSSATVSSAATPSSFYSMNGTMSMNGTEFASGLDTQSLIKALTANISSQIDTEKQMEQKTEWKRSMYQDVETMLQKFSDTYFSYASGSSTNIMSKSFFSGTNLTSSNPSVVTATGSRTDAGNLTIDSISPPATAASYMSGPVTKESITSTAAIGNSLSNLAGTTLTFQLDGLTKTITFDQSHSGDYSTVDGLANYLQGKMATAFGSNKISVKGIKANDSDSADNELSISTGDTTTSVLTLVSSSDSSILGADGLLHINSGETNRLDLSQTLGELSQDGKFATALDSSVNYTININGSAFTFNQNNTLNDVINKINSDPTANVTVSYSQTLDKFHIVSKDTGSQGQIKFQDAAGNLNAGNLGNTLFGGGTTTSGTDLTMQVQLDGGTEQTITRSTNSFTLDGISLNVNGSFNVANVTPPPDGPITFSGSDTDDLYKKISDFVDQYNAIIDKLNTYVATEPPSQATTAGGGTDYEPLTDDQKKTMTDAEITDWNTKAQQGLLFSDPELTSLQTSIRTAMEGNIASVGSSLASIGISTQPLDYTSGGKLVIDDTKLKNELSTEPDKVQQLFTNADGISSKLRNVLTNNIGYSGASGILYNIAGSSTATGADDSEFGQEIKDYDKQIKDLQTQLTDKQNNLQAKFTQMEMLISQLSSQSNYLSSMTSS